MNHRLHHGTAKWKEEINEQGVRREVVLCRIHVDRFDLEAGLFSVAICFDIVLSKNMEIRREFDADDPAKRQLGSEE